MQPRKMPPNLRAPPRHLLWNQGVQVLFLPLIYNFRASKEFKVKGCNLVLGPSLRGSIQDGALLILVGFHPEYDTAAGAINDSVFPAALAKYKCTRGRLYDYIERHTGVSEP